MPLIVNVGLSQKIGLPNYSSLGASVHVEYETDSLLLLTNVEAFQRQVQDAFAACRQAVQDELTRQDPASPAGDPLAASPSADQVAERTTCHTADPAADDRPAPSNGHPARLAARPRSSGLRRATANQIRAIEAIVARHNVDLAGLLAERFHTDQLSNLSITQASDLIDQLQTDSAAGGGRS
jgi:hypothetical protein